MNYTENNKKPSRKRDWTPQELQLIALCIEHRDNYKARYMQAKTDYIRICDSLRQAEGLVAKAQADLDSRIDQLSIVAFGLPGFDEIMNAVIGTLPAKKEE